MDKYKTQWAVRKLAAIATRMQKRYTIVTGPGIALATSFGAARGGTCPIPGRTRHCKSTDKPSDKNRNLTI